MFDFSFRVDWSGRGHYGDAWHDSQSVPVDETALQEKQIDRRSSGHDVPDTDAADHERDDGQQ